MTTVFPGVRLVVRGARRRAQVAGLADRVRGLPWTLDTRTQAASVSKQFTAACALILAGRGALRLDDPVRAYLPEAGVAWSGVRVRQLLTHTAGVVHWNEHPDVRASSTEPPERRLLMLLDAPRRQATGAEFHYSSPGYLILSAVLSAAAGQPYGQLVEGLVIEPLGLDGTSLGEPRPGVVARGYRGDSEVSTWNPRSMPGTGDVWTTASDLACFIEALHSGQLLTAPAQALLAEPGVLLQVPGDEAIQAHHYGAGHFVGTVNGRPAYLHPGDNPGFQALAIWYPDSGTVFVALCNDEQADIACAALEAL